jgi:hypothetical protein
MQSHKANVTLTLPTGSWELSKPVCRISFGGVQVVDQYSHEQHGQGPNQYAHYKLKPSPRQEGIHGSCYQSGRSTCMNKSCPDWTKATTYVQTALIFIELQRPWQQPGNAPKPVRSKKACSCRRDNWYGLKHASHRPMHTEARNTMCTGLYRY